VEKGVVVGEKAEAKLDAGPGAGDGPPSDLFYEKQIT